MSTRMAMTQAEGPMDLTGHKYNRLTVLQSAGRGRSPGGQTFSLWLCRCDCGTETTVRLGSLRSGHAKSCGCAHADELKRRDTKHGLAYQVPEYRIWKGMKSRCYSVTNDDYKNYGGRGISVCDEWRDNFEQFYKDMGPRPSAKHTIERVDVNGNYCPSNCCWLEAHLQSANRRVVKARAAR